MDRYNLKIDHIVDRYASLVMRDNNIIGMGRGRKNVNGIEYDTPSITFFVKKKVSKSVLSQSNVLPPSIGGVATDVFEIGEVKQRASNEKMRPARGGLSIGINFTGKPRSGTIGYMVIDRTGREKYVSILTSNHALTGFGSPYNKIVKVYQPALEFGGDVEKDEIGTIGRMIALKTGTPKDAEYYNEVDAALVYVGTDRNDEVNSKLIAKLYDTTVIKGVTDAVEDSLQGVPVLMQGATSGKVKGTILSERAVFKTSNKVSQSIIEDILYQKQVLCRINNDYGDSGALGYTRDGTKAFGILWGGSDDFKGGRVGIFSPIKRVLDLLKVDLILK